MAKIKKLNKIKNLERMLATKVSLIAPGAYYQEYLSSESGNKVLMGPHVTVYVPVAVYKPKVRRDLHALFDRVHSDIAQSKLGPLTTMSGSTNSFRQVILVQADSL